MSRKSTNQKSPLTIKIVRQKTTLYFICGLLVTFFIGIVTVKQSPAISLSTQQDKILVKETQVLDRNLHSSQDITLTQDNSENFPVQTAQLFNRYFANQMNQFPLGMYDRIDKPEHLSAIKNMGFNMVMPYTHPYAKKNYDTIKTYLDKANQLGLKVVLEPFRKSIKERDFAEVTKFVRAFKNHPAVYGWYSYDEPVYNKIPVKLLEDVYSLIKREDSNHPVILDFSGPRSHKLTSYRNSFDICKVNEYPIRKDSKNLAGLSSFQADIKDNARLIANNPFWLVVQSFGDQKWRLPNKIEQKYMLYSGLLNGANGVFFYGYHRAPLDWQNSVVKPLVGELNNYLPAIKEGAISGGANSQVRGVQAIAYKKPGTQEYIVIAINHESRRQQSQIDLAINHNNLAIEVLQENRTLNKSGTGFSDSFKPYEVHVYRVS